MPRRPSQSPLPPPLEMACLAILWDIGEGDVHQVVEILSANQKLAYTTVLTLLDRLAKRGQVSRRKQGRRFIYKPMQDSAILREAAIDELVRLYFGGSRDSLRSWLRSAPANQAAETSAGSFDPALL